MSWVAGGEEEEVDLRQLAEIKAVEEGGAHGGRATPFRGKDHPGGWGRREARGKLGPPGGEIQSSRSRFLGLEVWLYLSGGVGRGLKPR